jgi:response regulator RpfG family c-di-GMP phosphodiesterase
MKKSPRFILLDDDLFTLAIEKYVIRNYCRRAEIINFSACKEAIEYIEAECLQDRYPNTILLTDLHMPEIDGFELLDRMEKIFKRSGVQLHIFVLSGAACLDEIRRVLAYSCVTGFYQKPLSIDKLSHIITCVEYPL